MRRFSLKICKDPYQCIETVILFYQLCDKKWLKETTYLQHTITSLPSNHCFILMFFFLAFASDLQRNWIDDLSFLMCKSHEKNSDGIKLCS